MKNETELERFTDEECIVLASLARKHFELMEFRKEHLKELPEENRKKLTVMEEQLEFAYGIFLDNANKMFDESNDPRSMGFGLILMGMNELNLLKGEEELQGSIMDKISDFLLTVPEWMRFVEITRKRKGD